MSSSPPDSIQVTLADGEGSGSGSGLFLLPKRLEAPASSLLGADLSQTLSLSQNKSKGKGRVLVAAGKSMVQWMRKQSEAKTPPPPKTVTLEELSSHNTLGDVWMAIGDRVYDVSEYVDYHPGGLEEIMKGAGQDATSIFNQVHRWVNHDSILRKQLVGVLVKDGSSSKPEEQLAPVSLFSQDSGSVFLQIDCGPSNESICRNSWTVGILNRERLLLKVVVKPPKVWTAHLKLFQALVDDTIQVEHQQGFRKLVLRLKKPKREEKWLKLGSPLSEHNQIADSRYLEDVFYPGKMTLVKQLTHNTFMYAVKLSGNLVLGVPVGFHVAVRLKYATKPYTPVPASLLDDAKEDPEVLHFIIKVYPDGEFTSLLTSAFKGHSVVDVNVSSPRGSFDPFAFLYRVGVLVMLAAGSGLTPMLEVIRFLRDRRRSLPVSNLILMFFCNNVEEIICKEELDHCAETLGDWFRVAYVLSRDQNDSGEISNVCEFTGRVSPDLLQKYFEKQPVHANGEWTLTKALVCGSHGFNAAAKQSLCHQTMLTVDSSNGIFVF